MLDLNFLRPKDENKRNIFNYIEKSTIDDLTVEYNNKELEEKEKKKEEPPRRSVFYNLMNTNDIYPTSKEDLEEFVVKNYVLRDAINNIEANVLPYKYILEELIKQEAALSAVVMTLLDPQAIAATEKKLKAIREALAILPKYYPDEEELYYYYS